LDKKINGREKMNNLKLKILKINLISGVIK